MKTGIFCFENYVILFASRHQRDGNGSNHDILYLPNFPLLKYYENLALKRKGLS